MNDYSEARKQFEEQIERFNSQTGELYDNMADLCQGLPYVVIFNASISLARYMLELCVEEAKRSDSLQSFDLTTCISSNSNYIDHVTKLLYPFFEEMRRQEAAKEKEETDKGLH